MILGTAIISIAIVSVLLAFRSLKQLEKIEKVSEVKRELRRGKVVFQRDSSSPPASSSD